MTVFPRGCLGVSSVFLLLALGACTATPPTNFYVLSSLADEDPSAGALAEVGPLLGVGPVEIPAYLDQPEIASRTAANTLALSEFHQWAEPLQDGATRVLAEDLSQLLPASRIAVFPWRRADPVHLQAIVRLVRFEVRSDHAQLVAEWRLVSAEDGVVLSCRSRIDEPVIGQDHAARVAAMSTTLARLAKEIAVAISEALGN